ncbi:MAG: sulfate ABC transporter permease [Pyrobaculum sp.]
MAYIASPHAVAGTVAAALLFLLAALPLVYLQPPPPGFLESIALTAVFGAISAALALAPGLAAAMITRSGWGLLSQVFYIPAVVPPTSVGVLLLASFQVPRAACIGGVEWTCGLAAFVSEHVVNKPLGILIAMWVMALPIAFSIYDGALREERAEVFFKSLGYSGMRLMWVMMRSLRSATASAFIFAWIRSFGELGVLLIFASYPPTAAIYIYNAWLTYGVGPAVGASLAVATVAFMMAYLARRWLSR